MATNILMNEPTSEFVRFDIVATDIVNIFELLIVQFPLHTRLRCCL